MCLFFFFNYTFNTHKSFFWHCFCFFWQLFFLKGGHTRSCSQMLVLASFFLATFVFQTQPKSEPTSSSLQIKTERKYNFTQSHNYFCTKIKVNKCISNGNVFGPKLIKSKHFVGPTHLNKLCNQKNKSNSEFFRRPTHHFLICELRNFPQVSTDNRWFHKIFSKFQFFVWSCFEKETFVSEFF